MKESPEAIALLKEYFRYDPSTGEFWWKQDLGRKIKAGKIAGSIHHKKKPYTVLRLRGERYPAHRVAWAFHYGEWPEGFIDHINHIPSDNRISNLRVVDVAENNLNKSLSRHNKSGHNGISRRIRPGRKPKWNAKIQVNSKAIYLGDFDTLEEAIAARETADIKYGFHENHGNKKAPQRDA